MARWRPAWRGRARPKHACATPPHAWLPSVPARPPAGQARAAHAAAIRNMHARHATSYACTPHAQWASRRAQRTVAAHDARVACATQVVVPPARHVGRASKWPLPCPESASAPLPSTPSGTHHLLLPARHLLLVALVERDHVRARAVLGVVHAQLLAHRVVVGGGVGRAGVHHVQQRARAAQVAQEVAAEAAPLVRACMGATTQRRAGHGTHTAKGHGGSVCMMPGRCMRMHNAQGCHAATDAGPSACSYACLPAHQSAALRLRAYQLPFPISPGVCLKATLVFAMQARTLRS